MTWIINPGRRSWVVLVLHSDRLPSLGVGRMTNFQIVPRVNIHLRPVKYFYFLNSPTVLVFPVPVVPTTKMQESFFCFAAACVET